MNNFFDNVKEIFLGMVLSVVSWEAWENFLVAMAVAFTGGFMASAGKQLHKCYLDWRHRKKLKDEQKESD